MLPTIGSFLLLTMATVRFELLLAIRIDDKLKEPMTVSPEKDLLFGIIALQMSLVRSEQLVAAVSTWLMDKSHRLDEILVDQGALNEYDRQLLAPLVARHLDNHGGDPQRSFAALGSIGSIADDLLGDENLMATLSLGSGDRSDRLHAATIVFNESMGASTTSRTVSDDVKDRFRILRSHAKGGLGEVYVAKDTELNREVALKEIQSKYADDESNRLRFLLEAEVTGGLEHPGIVPVYGLGRYDDGRPFYAMRFIKGSSLQEAADQFHRHGMSERQPTSTRAERHSRAIDFRGLEFRKLLGRFIDVCQAIEYAHSRGVLHRDLKPGNIMLGQYGETLVVDWGLAKTQDVNTDGGLYDESKLRPVSASESAPTMMGSAIGTPAFMPPEQAAGNLDELGAPSDVYSLGATLYYMLTGQAPFQGRNLRAILQDVKTGNFPAPREIQPGIPKALEAICQKAMATEVTRRYRSPSQLAEEIERFLADEPVGVYAEPVFLRLRRWLRKHQTLATSTAAVVLVTVAGLVVFSSIVSGKNAKLSELNLALDSRNNELTELNTTLDDRNEQLDKRNTQLLAANQRAEAAAASAVASAASERKQRDRAERARYLSDLGLALAFLEDEQQVESIDLLLNHYPRRDQQDHRGWEWHYLLGRADPSLMSWIASRSNIPSIDWSSDGGRLATLDWTGAGAVLWDPESGKPQISIAAGRSIKLGVDWHPSEDRVAWGAAVSDAQVRIFDLKSGEIIPLQEDTGSHRYVRWSPDGQRLAVGCININQFPRANNLGIWQREGDQWRTLSNARMKPGAGVDVVEWSPDSKELLVVGRSSFTWVLDPQSLDILREVPERTIRSAAWHPTQPRLACGKTSGEILILDSQTMQVTRRFNAHRGEVNTVSWSPDGDYLASGGQDRSVNVWSMGEFELVGQYVGHRGGVSQVCWHPDSKRVASCSTDGRVTVWPREQVASPTVLVSREGIIDGVIKTKPRFEWLDDNAIRASHTSKEIIDWDVRTAEIIHRIQLPVLGRLLSRTHTCRSSDKGITVSPIQPESDGAIVDAVLTPSRFVWPNPYSDHLVAFCKSNGEYQATGGMLVRDLRLNESKRLGRQPLTRVGDVQWSADQKWIVVVGGGMPTDGGTDQYAGWINLFDANTGAMANRTRLGASRVVVVSAAWSPDSKRIVAGNEEGHCQVFEAPGLQTILGKRMHLGSTQSLDWHPTENRVASGGSDGKVMIWHPVTGDVLLTFDVGTAIDRVAWSPQGHQLAAMDAAGKIHVWDAEPGMELVRSNRLGRELVEQFSQRMLGSLEYDTGLALDAAREMLRVGVPVSPQDYCFAAVLAYLHDDQVTLNQCVESMSAQHLSSNDLRAARLTAWALALIPGALEDYEPLVAAARHLLETEPTDRQVQLCLALSLLRAQRDEEARSELASVAVAQDDGRASFAELEYLQAFAAYRQKNSDAAEKHLEEARRLQTESPPQSLFALLSLRVLEQEAKEIALKFDER